MARSYRPQPSDLPIHRQPDPPPYLRHLVLLALCHMSNVVDLKRPAAQGGWVVVGVSQGNWRRRPPVTFYSLTLPDYRQLMHNKYTALRVHYRLINILLWTTRMGLPKWQVLFWDYAGLTMSPSREGTWRIFLFCFYTLLFSTNLKLSQWFDHFRSSCCSETLSGSSWFFEALPYASCLPQALQL